jgi:transcriptional regulator with XRE-family HTH domain/tetratricopeptide (TPR) repeat protein
MTTGIGKDYPEDVRKVVQFGREQGWTMTQTTKTMHALCDVSLLKAHRLARDWTLRDLITELVVTAEKAGLPSPGVTIQRINYWEEGERPSQPYIDLLCRIFQTRPDRLGFGHDHTPAEELKASAQTMISLHLGERVGLQPWDGDGKPLHPLRSWRRDLLSGYLSSEGVLNAASLGALDELCQYSRARLDHLPVSRMALEGLEDAALGHAAEFWFAGPSRLVSEVAADYHQVESVLSDRLSTDLRSRAWLVQARLAGLVGWGLVEAGIPALARDWFHLAASVAKEHEDGETRIWAVTLGALAALAVADWSSADKIADAALMVAEKPSPVTVMAYHLQAEARAGLGHSAEALRALQAAELEAAHREGGSPWYRVAYPWELYWTQRGHILLRLGMTDEAAEALSTGLEVANRQAHRLRAHIRLDLIACQALDPHERAEQIKAVAANVPEDQWSARLRAHLAEARVHLPLPRPGRDDNDQDDEEDGAGVPVCC